MESSSELHESNKSLFLEKVRLSNAACQNGDFSAAVQLYTEAILLDPANHVLYSNRSAAYLKEGKFGRALQDAIRARELNAKWPKAYYRQGMALQCLGRHSDALAAFASGLAQDPKNLQLLAGLVEAAMKSPLRATLEPTYRQLQTMRLDKSPFVITSVIGQELLASGHHAASVVVLESALRVGTCSLKLRGSVFSALSSAYWALNSLDRAIAYMQQDLAVAKSLGDQMGECRAHGNLGSAYFSKGSYKEALTSHRYQLVLAMKNKDTQAAACALTSLGHVYTAIGDYPNALASHKQCVQLVRQMGDRLQEAREIGNVGAVYLAMGDFDKAVECHMEHLALSKQLGNKVEEARAYSNLGSSHHYRRNFEQAIMFHHHVLRLAQELGDRTVEARAYAGLGHAARCMGDYQQAKRWHERQLDMALSTKDKMAEGRACSNLGIVYQLFGDFDAALKLHQAHLNIARALNDRAGMGRAYGNIGNAYSAMERYEQAIKFHKQELTISKEVNDRSAEASTHGNLAVAYQALAMHEMALLHYHSHLSIARELKDTAGEACALCNLGNCYSSRGEFSQAVPYYENYYRLSQEIQDVEGEAKACHFLGYAHYCLSNYQEAIGYYEQDLALAKDLQDRMNMGQAYCNLGLSHLALGHLQAALECQKYFLAIAQMMKHIQGKFRALGNMGDVLMKMKNISEAVQVYHKQLLLSKQSSDKTLEAASFGALGLCHRQMKCFDKALGYHTQELTLRQELLDVKGECRAHGHLGAVHMSLGNYTHAMKCYEEQLERAKELRDCMLEAQALGNLGICRLNMAHYEDAIGYIEQQLALLEQLGSSSVDKGRAFGNLGDCYDALGDFEEAVKCHEQYLAIALKGQCLRDQERAYRGLGNSHCCLGGLPQALVCFEKRLVVAHDLANASSKALAYGELGAIHSQLGNLEQAVSCLEHQSNVAREMGDKSLEGESLCGLGGIFHQMGDYEQALRYHQMDLALAEETGNMSGQGRAYGNLGVVHEALRNYEQAIMYQEQHLSVAAQINDKVAKTLAYGSLGRVHHALGNIPQAVAYLQQGLQIAEQLVRREDEAKLRHRLGLALWGNEDLEPAQQQLYLAAELFQNIRHEAKGSSERKVALFDLQMACYQALQRVLVSVGRSQEALVVAERSRTRAFVDLLMERQASAGGSSSSPGQSLFTLNTIEHLVDTVNRQKATLLYYSLAAGYLYIWVIAPGKGILKFHESCLSDLSPESGPQRAAAETTGPCEGESGSSLLEQHIVRVREALGVDIGGSLNNNGCENESEAGDLWQQHLEEMGDKMIQESDKSGFLRMVNRGHLFNSSNYSLSSLFSVGSIGGSIASGSTSRPGSTRSRRFHWQGPAPLHYLYDLLITPIQSCLPTGLRAPELLLVLDGDLYMVPFAMLKGDSCEDYLCERYSISAIPSISALRASQRSSTQTAQNSRDYVSALVVGNPKLPPPVLEQWGWNDIPQAQQEASLVGEMLGTKPVTGAEATKEVILAQLAQAECVHLAVHVSWKMLAVVLSPGEVVESTSSRPTEMRPQDTLVECCEDSSLSSSTSHVPPFSDFLLTAADILNLRLSARLVVISSCHTRNHHGKVTSDGLVGLTRALLAAGAQCVLVSLWPVPDTAVKILLRTFYSSLLQGSRVSVALSEAMRTIQTTKHFAHPANWASFFLVGSDVKLSSQVALLGQALADLLKAPDKSRDTFRVVLHLVEKSLQRIHRGHKNAMYTTQKSIENKVGHMGGWRELLIAVGFRFEPASNGLPASVFFPQSDPAQRLSQCSASLQALLGLSTVSLNAISKLLSSPDSAENIIQLLSSVLDQLSQKDPDSESIECPVSVKLWSIPGCHELLASLGFDLMEVGRDEVTLRMGKQANRRAIQFAQQTLTAIFETPEAPQNLMYQNSSSLESLDSVASESRATPPPSAPYPLPRPALASSLMLGSSTGAFTSYVRTRGEPDGRTATSGSDQKNRDSDTFTPSPVDTLSKAFVAKGHTTGPHMALALAHQRKIRTMYGGSESPPSDSNKRPDSSSSASSLTDWDSGQSTIRRQEREYESVPYLSHNVGKVLMKKDANAVSQFLNLDASARAPPTFRKVNGSVEQFSAFEQPPESSRSDFCKTRSNPSILDAHLVPKMKSISRFLESLNHYEEIGPLSATSYRLPSKHNLEVSTTQRGHRKENRKAFSKGRSYKGKDDLNIPIESLEIGMDDPEGPSSTYSDRTVNHHPMMHTEHHLEDINLRNPRIHQLGREPPITEVYHDRTMGLGLAPSLSKILTSDLNSLNDSLQEVSSSVIMQPPPLKRVTGRIKPPLPPKHSARVPPAPPKSHKFSGDSSSEGISVDGDVKDNLEIRDQGDGGSFTETSCPSHRLSAYVYQKHEKRTCFNGDLEQESNHEGYGINWHKMTCHHKNSGYDGSVVSQGIASESEGSDLDSNSSQKMMSTVRRNPRHAVLNKDIEKSD